LQAVSDKHAFLDEALGKRKTEHRYRSLNAMIPGENGLTVRERGQEFINFSSNDYLGLSREPSLIARTAEYSHKYGAGATASRLITGTLSIHTKLEKDLAVALNREAALLFTSGFQANSSILSTVTDRHSLILADKRSHNSLLQGALASRSAFQRFNHNDTEHLEKLLQKAADKNYNRIWIVTETVFSMGGDRSPIDDIAKLSEQYNALLFVDDAHAVGVWGDKGLGLARDVAETDIVLGTCGKAFGSFGAYVACSKKMRDYLVNFCPGFIYTTALPPAVIGATQAALERIPSMQNERQKLHRRIADFRKELQQLGFYTGLSTTQIIPVIIGSEKETLDLEAWLREKGIRAVAVRPPTVPEESSRIRFTLSLSHTEEHFELLVNALKSWNNA
jgi:8-amino-7-oxononanoate synthase